MHLLGKCTKFYTVPPLRLLSPTIKRSLAKQSYIHHIGEKPLIYRNIGQQLEWSSAEYRNTEAVVSYHENKRRTYAALLDEADRLAGGFYKIGLKRGDRVAIWAPNTLQWYLTMMGIARAGMISVGINPAFQAAEVEYCLQKVNVNAVVASETLWKKNNYDVINSICLELANSRPGHIKSQKFPDLRAVIIDTDSKLKGAFSFNECLDMCANDDLESVRKLQAEISPDLACNIQFTSGTTGKPKAAMLSHFNCVNNGFHIGERNELLGQRICVQVPFFHVYGVVITIMSSMTNGGTLVLPAAGFDPEASLRAILAEKCSVIHGTPTMYVDLIKKQNELKLPITSAKKAISGGAPCSPQLFLDMQNVLGVEKVRCVYGLTESTSVVFQSRPGDSTETVLHSVGHILDHVEAKVVDTAGNIVPLGQPGELCVRGYVTMLGYYGDEAKTKETIGGDKWLKTGDQFILEENGYGRIVGRIKDVIIRGGENIFPKEVEDFLNAHPDILESQVIGVPDERLGEDVCAFIRVQEGAEERIDYKSLKAYAKGKVAHFKVPRHVIITKDFPKTTSGKIQKFKLLKIFEEEHKIKTA